MLRALRLTEFGVVTLLLGGCLALDQGGRGSSSGLPGGWFGSPSGWGTKPVTSSHGVVCDPHTEICYKNGRIDQTETRAAFGKDAAHDADNIRDDLPSSRVYVPRQGSGSYCLRDQQVCYRHGHPDESDTRDVFGKKAARRLPD